MALISVIIPVYNVEKYLDRCVGSVVCQTFRDTEIILIDDGSPDRCPEMCDEWAAKDSRIKVIHQANQGLSGARNTGIRACTGEYITFVDSDDWISETMLADLLRLIRKHDADISLCGFVSADGENQPDIEQRNRVRVYDRDQFMKIIMRINGNRSLHYAWGKLYARKTLDFETHFPLGMYNEDVEGCFKAVLKANKLVETSKTGYYYFENPESITRKRFGENFLSLTRVWKRMEIIAEKEAPEYIDYVRYNRKRTDFTILMDMILFSDRETDKKYAENRKMLLKRLRSNVVYLLKSPMRFDRKLMMLMVCYCYFPFGFSVRCIKKSMNRSRIRNSRGNQE